MPQIPDSSPPTRMIFIGESALADGFGLVGFETLTEMAPQAIEQLLRQLIDERLNAFVVMDAATAAQDIPAIREIRAEGGRIVLSVVPPLNRPDGFRDLMDPRLQTLLAHTNFTAGE